MITHCCKHVQLKKNGEYGYRSQYPPACKADALKFELISLPKKKTKKQNKKKQKTKKTNFIENWRITNYITFPPANSL